jgi:hypothetical protein
MPPLAPLAVVLKGWSRGCLWEDANEAASRVRSGRSSWGICLKKILLDAFCSTLIQPGEVKIDLANFDVKFRTKFFLYLYIFFLDVIHIL